jgi:hypothetical protein
MEQLLEKLVKSKAIMDKHNEIKRGDVRSQLPNNVVESFDVPQAKYNIPEEFTNQSIPQMGSQSPVTNTTPVGVPTVDAIKKSKLPDEIKRLMIEHPISQPQQYTATISNDVIEKASRLMKDNNNNYIPESATTNKNIKSSNEIDYNQIQIMIESAVEKVLKKNGIISESSEKVNEGFTFKVGRHIFEGKINKIKKVG